MMGRATKPTGIKWIKELTSGNQKDLVLNLSGEPLSWVCASKFSYRTAERARLAFYIEIYKILFTKFYWDF